MHLQGKLLVAMANAQIIVTDDTPLKTKEIILNGL
jgi:hypothetical protein